MLFTITQEIDHIIPTSKFKSLDKLISRLNAEEMSTLYPLIGKELLDQLNEDYEVFRNKDGGLWSCAKQESKDQTRVTILQTAEEVLLYSYLANHSAILQSSFNMGGGWNKPSTENYEALDPKDNERLDKDLWHSALRAKENLLLYLEIDARAEQVYTEKWKHSDYFYLHQDLLFTTSSELHPLYINLGDTPHITFQKYISTLHDCQDGYIAGTIGYTLLQALIDRKYKAAEPQPSAQEPSDQENPQPSALSPQSSEWNTLDRHIRTSLANFTAYEMGGAKNEHLRNRGQSQLSIATRFIHEHYDTFSEYIPEGAPIYVPPKPDPAAEESMKATTHTTVCPGRFPPPPPPPHQGTVFSLLH